MPDFIEKLERVWPPAVWIDLHVLVAVSGGPDSMALLRGLLEVKRRYGGRGDLVAAHVHHGLRPSADEDERWLAAELGRLGVSFRVRRVEVRELAAEQGDGLEAAARSLRYATLQSMAEEVGARFVTTGHTADDQAETVLHRILRGTGIEGLAGIPTFRPLGPTAVLVRPLLNVTRQEVRDCLSAVGQPFREDPTNRDLAFTRNRIRHELMPQLRREYNPALEQALLRLAGQAAEVQTLIQPLVEDVLNRSVKIAGDRIQLDAACLRDAPEPLARAVLRAAWRRAGWPEQQVTDATWRRVSASLGGGMAERLTLPGAIDAWCDGGLLVLERKG